MERRNLLHPLLVKIPLREAEDEFEIALFRSLQKVPFIVRTSCTFHYFAEKTWENPPSVDLDEVMTCVLVQMFCWIELTCGNWNSLNVLYSLKLFVFPWSFSCWHVLKKHASSQPCLHSVTSGASITQPSPALLLAESSQTWLPLHFYPGSY